MRLQLPAVQFRLLLYLCLLTVFSVSPNGPSSSSNTKFFFSGAVVVASAPNKIPVGLVLDLSINSVVGRTSRTSIFMAVEDFYADLGRNYTTRIDLRLRDYNGDVLKATAAVVDLVKNESVVTVIGPQRPADLVFVAEIGTAVHVPIISFSPYFIRAVNNDSAQAAAIASLAQAFGWHQLVPVYEDSQYGVGFLPLLVDALREVADCRVPTRAAIPPRADKVRIRAELLRLKTLQTRVFVVHAGRSLTQKVFEVMKEEDVGMLDQGYAWIVTENMASQLEAVAEEQALEIMQGVVGVRPYVPVTPRLKDFKRRWKKQFVKENLQDDHAYDTMIGTYGLRAYDTVFALAEAVELVYGGKNSGAAMSGVVPVVATTPHTKSELSSLPVSRAGELLLNTIVRTRISNGISGHFQFVGCELCCTTLEIVNVDGRSPIPVGYWSESRGLSRKPEYEAAVGNTTQRLAAKREDLELIKWPGRTAATPKGWAQDPVAGKRLKVYLPGPTESGFHAFLNSELDNSTNVTMRVGGFVVEVFEAAVKELPYAIIWEYHTGRTKDGRSIGNYSQLVELVQNGTYDGIVGDVTITASRAARVDFTLPYTTSGVRMVVPKQDDSSINLWIFLKPLTNSLWIVSGCFFVWTGIAVWISEHRVNEDFHHESIADGIGSVFYFSFSTLVFAHGNRINGNAPRIALLVWLFVVLILQSSYTASLTSMLTVKQVRPTVTEITDLLSSDEYIGYLENSFVKSTLKNMGFDEKRLRHYKSPEQYADALARGSRNGGVGAVVDEIPYLKIFLKDYCANYTITGQTIPAGGFGFVFPKGSPLVPDLSRAILSITEGNVMAEIERKWFGDESECTSDDSPFSSNRLDLPRFGGLFIISGTVTLAALLWSLFKFLYNCRQILLGREGGGSFPEKVKSLKREFDKKKGDGNEGSLGRSSLRQHHSSNTHVCVNCGYNGVLPGLVGGGGAEVGSESAVSIIVHRPVLGANGGDTTSPTHRHSTSRPMFVNLSTPPRTSIDSPYTDPATPSIATSPARSITRTESSSKLSLRWTT